MSAPLPSNASCGPAHRPHLRAWTVAILAALAFLPSLMNQFALDDGVHLVSNTAIRTLHGTIGSLGEPSFPGNLFRPLVTLSYGLTYALVGLNPFWYHLTNIVAHVLVSLLVYRLFVRMGVGNAACLGAVLFAINPIHSETVANTTGRAELFAALFGFLFLELSAGLSARPSGKTSDFVSELACCAVLLLALCSKESALVFFPLFLLLSYYQGGRGRTLWQRSQPGLLSLALYFSLRLIAFDGALFGPSLVDSLDNPLVGISPALRVLNALGFLGYYLKLILLPDPLSADYSFAALLPFGSAASPALLPLLCAVTLFFGISVWAYFRRSLSGLWGLWFFVAFMVTSNVFLPIGTIFAERLAYLPSVGVCGLLVSAFSSPSRRRRVPVTLFFWMLTPLFLVASMVHSVMWFNDQTLASYQIHISPQSAKTQLNYAVLMRNQGKLDLARVHTERALGIFPEYEDAYELLGSIALLEGNVTIAEHNLRQALRINPLHVPSLNRYGRLLLNRGSFDEAAGSFSRALQVNPRDSDALIGNFAVALNRRDTAQARAIEAKLVQMKVENAEFDSLRNRLR